MDELRAIDIVEKMRSYLLGQAPAIEKELLLYREQTVVEQPAETVKLVFLTLVLNEDLNSAAARRRVKRQLDLLENSPIIPAHSPKLSKTEQFYLAEQRDDALKSMPAGRTQLIQTQLKTIEEWCAHSETGIFNQLRDCKSGIQAAGLISERLPLLKGCKSYQLLLELNYGIVLPEKRRVQLLRRLRLLAEGGASALVRRQVAEVTEELQRLSGESLAGLNLILGLFSGAEKWGVKPSPLCLSQPNCPACPLTNYCHYFQSEKARQSDGLGSVSSLRRMPLEQRPRELLKRYGAAKLSDAELLAVILRTGTARTSVLELSKQLLQRFESLDSLYAAAVAEISQLPGIGEAKATGIKAALELGKRLLDAESKDLGVVSSSKDVYHLYRGRLAKEKQELFYVLLLDTKNRIFKEVQASRGSLNASLVHPREVFKEAIRESTASVIFIHNHPSGDTRPSNDDIALTHRLYETGEIIGIKVLDHIIIGSKLYYSFADDSLLRSK